jgi:uncharacterized protein YndB with AHSA1/START domain
MSEQAVITCDQFFAHPPQAVWRALTEPDLLARWWVPGDIEPTVGHRFTLDMGKWGPQPCQILAVEPGKLLVYSFAEGQLDSTITWRLEPEGTGTRLFLEHAGLDLGTPMGRMAFEGMGAGWPGVVKQIDVALSAAIQG